MSSRRTRAFHSETWLDQATSDLSDNQRRWVYVLVLLLAASLLAFGHLAQTGYVVREMEEMGNSEAMLLDLKRGSNALRLEIAEYERWAHLRREARDLGFAEPQHIEYIEVLASEAPGLASEEGTPDEDSPSLPVPSPDSLIGWRELASQFAAWVLGEQVDAEAVGGVQ